MPAPDGGALTSTVTVPLTIDRAFDLFSDLARWWPREYHPGRVIELEPPRRLVLALQARELGQNPGEPGTVEVRLIPDGAQRTRVTIAHRDLDRHSEEAAEDREAMASDRGWPLILERYAAAAATDGASGND